LSSKRLITEEELQLGEVPVVGDEDLSPK